MSNMFRQYERRMMRAKGLLPAKKKVRRTAYKPWTKALLKMFESFREKQKAMQEQKKASVAGQLEREVEGGEKETDQEAQA